MSLRLRGGVAWAVSAVLVGGALEAQQAGPPEALTRQIDRIFSTGAYAAPRFGPARWLPDGRAYAIVEPSQTQGGFDIVRYEAATGARSILMPASRLVPPGATAPITIEDYAWSADGTRLLIFTNTRRVWRDNTRGDYWVLTLATSELRKLGGAAPEASLMFAKFSPDATRVAYVRSNNIYVEHLADRTVVPLTLDGSATTINGTSDWVYEEELGVRDCFRWSPDGRRIAYWQFDTTGVGEYILVNSTDTLYPQLTRIPYPKAGTTNSAVRIGVVPAEGGRTTWLKAEGDPRNTYVAKLDWVDASTVALQQLNRLQNRNDFLLADATTGAVRRVYRDESKQWVDVEDARWIDGGRAFLWVTERDGWRHVYRVPKEGGAATLVTRFDADIAEVVGLDERGGWLYAIASPQALVERHLYRSRLDGTGAPERVSPQSQPGTHTYEFDPTGRTAFHTYSRLDVPPVTDVVAMPDHRSLRSLTDNMRVREAAASLVSPPAEFFTVQVADGATLDGWLLKPPAFDPSRRYPMVAFVYGEAANVTASDRWRGGQQLFNRALAQAGYVVVSVDNRGTPTLRGAGFRKAVYGAVGELSSQDQAQAMQALLRRHSFLDPARVGVWGWSGGGSSTLNAMFRYPDVFHVGVAVAPVPDERLYDTIYQERYMGLPQDNADGYRRGSPITFAEGLRGRLLLIHGSGDDNVHYQGTERLTNRLIELGKMFDQMVYPNRTHGISEGHGTSAHVYNRIARHFIEHLPAGPR
jgi:dipeptidyl-peptidase-4